MSAQILGKNMGFLDKFPRELAGGSKPAAASYALAPDRYAIHRQEAGEPAAGADHVLNEGKIAVFKGEAPISVAAVPGGKVSAVYTLTSGGSLAVPTGLVFVRLADGLDVTRQTEAFADAGYEVAERLDYAPNAVWLKARSGDIADALNGLDALKKLPNVESVEPQMLMESARR